MYVIISIVGITMTMFCQKISEFPAKILTFWNQYVKRETALCDALIFNQYFSSILPNPDLQKFGN